MNQNWKIIKELESNKSRLFKEGIIERIAKQDNDEFFIGCKLALDKLISFGIKQIPNSFKSGKGLKWNEFLLMTEQFLTRKITGNSARDLLLHNMEKSEMNEWNFWYRRILLKDLQCGVSEKTINNVINKIDKHKYSIPVFACMLAHDSNNHEKKLIGEKFLDFKLDGVRVISIFNFENKSVNMFSRNGKELFNFKHIAEEIKEKISPNFDKSMVLDGEVISDTFQSLMKQVYNKSETLASDARLALFDILPLKEFLDGKSILGCIKRHEFLKHLINTNKMESIFLLSKKLVNLDIESGQKIFKEMNRLAIEKGYEGIMIKDVYAPYECKRSFHMLKAKPFIQVSLKVMDLEAGSGRNTGVLGALVCEGVDDGKKIITNVGSGLTDENRKEFWENKDMVIGRTVEIRADAITQNQNSKTYSLRFPRFLNFRNFDKNENLI